MWPGFGGAFDHNPFRTVGAKASSSPSVTLRCAPSGRYRAGYAMNVRWTGSPEGGIPSGLCGRVRDNCESSNLDAEEDAV